MKSDFILFAPNLRKIEDSRQYVDCLNCEELVSELFIGEIIILENSADGRYLFLENVDALGFVLNLRLRISQMKGENRKSERLTSQHQFYDIEIRTEKDSLFLRDHTQSNDIEVRLNTVAFQKNLTQCSSELYQYLLTFFPSLSSRADSDVLRRWFNVSGPHSGK